MKLRNKITLGLMAVVSVILLVICTLVYTVTVFQRKTVFKQRLENRALTVASILLNVTEMDEEILKKIDSSTYNLLDNVCINVYDNRNNLIYRFVRSQEDTVNVKKEAIQAARTRGKTFLTLGDKEMALVSYKDPEVPVVVAVAANDTEGKKNIRQLLQILLLAFLSGLLLAAVTAWLMSKLMLRPLKKITETVNTISATSIEKRLQESNKKDEWYELTRTFNHLLSRLQESFEVQGRFIANASHELSTPLTAISNQIDVTLRQPRSAEDYLKTLKSVQADTLHLSELTHQLLDIARTARGGAIQTEPVRVDELLIELPSMIRKIDSAYTVKMHFDDLPDEEIFCTVHGNGEVLMAAIKNIAENGCKYSPDNEVHISLSFIQKKIVLLFSNKAGQLRPETLNDIFHPFQRGDNIKGQKGYGLGLSLARRIILLHKGEIKAELQPDNAVLISVILPSVASEKE